MTDNSIIIMYLITWAAQPTHAVTNLRMQLSKL